MLLHRNAIRCDSDVQPDQASLQGIPELLREVTVLGMYRHPNIVPLLSYSLARSDDGRQEACLVCPPMTRI